MFAKFLSKLAKKREETLEHELKLALEEVQAQSARAEMFEKNRDVVTERHRTELGKRIAAEKRCKELSKEIEQGKAKEGTSKLFEGLGEAALFWFEADGNFNKVWGPAMKEFDSGLLTQKGVQQAMGTRPVTLSRACEGLKKAVAALLENQECQEILKKKVKEDRLTEAMRHTLVYKREILQYQEDPEAYMRMCDDITILERKLK